MVVTNLARHPYEVSMEPARTRFSESRTLSLIQAPDINPALLELFHLYFTSVGVAMTERVEDWIRRAGERCEQIGLRELGRALRVHSNQEAGHHVMLIEDTRLLVDRWNARHSFALEADLILGQGMTEGVRRYRKLHEDGISGDCPFCQLAIEYEIERLSVRFGPRLIDQCMKVLGSPVMAGLGFLRQHVSLDVGHTRFNEGQLNSLLDLHPEYLMALVNTGKEALHAYSMFLDDCLCLAEVQIGRTR
jgi:hypothetical protein